MLCIGVGNLGLRQNWWHARMPVHLNLRDSLLWIGSGSTLLTASMCARFLSPTSSSSSGKASPNRVSPGKGKEKSNTNQASPFSAAAWKEHLGLEISDPPPLPEKIDTILKRRCPHFNNKRIFETHRLVLIPAGISLAKLIALGKDAKGAPIFDPVQIEDEYLEEEVKESYWILLTTEIVPESDNKDYSGCLKKLENTHCDPNPFFGYSQEQYRYRMPTALEIIAASLAEKKQRKASLYSKVSRCDWTAPGTKEQKPNETLIVKFSGLIEIRYHEKVLKDCRVGMGAAVRFPPRQSVKIR